MKKWLRDRRNQRRLRAFVKDHGITGFAKVLADGAIVDEHHAPYLQQFTRTADEYYAMHLAYIDGGPWGLYVDAEWGLIARGRDSLPFLQVMLASKEAESRSSAASVLGEIAADDPTVVEVLIAALQRETDTEARDTLVMTMGRLGKTAIAPLARIITDPETDGDTQWTAIENLGKVVRRRFLAQPDPIAAALEWIAKHPDVAR